MGVVGKIEKRINCNLNLTNISHAPINTLESEFGDDKALEELGETETFIRNLEYLGENLEKVLSVR